MIRSPRQLVWTGLFCERSAVEQCLDEGFRFCGRVASHRMARLELRSACSRTNSRGTALLAFTPMGVGPEDRQSVDGDCLFRGPNRIVRAAARREGEIPRDPAAVCGHFHNVRGPTL